MLTKFLPQKTERNGVDGVEHYCAIHTTLAASRTGHDKIMQPLDREPRVCVQRPEDGYDIGIQAPLLEDSAEFVDVADDPLRTMLRNAERL